MVTETTTTTKVLTSNMPITSMVTKTITILDNPIRYSQQFSILYSIMIYLDNSIISLSYQNTTNIVYGD